MVWSERTMDLSSEDTVLLLTCRPALGDDENARLRRIFTRPLDWSLILWKSETYQTVPLLLAHIERLGLTEAVDDWIIEYLRNWSALSSARSVEQFRELAKVVNLLENLNIDYFILKGAALSTILYGDPVLRPMQDLDVMILPSAAWRVQRAIYELGYKHGVFDPSSGRFTHMFRRITRRSLQFKHALHSVTKTVTIANPLPAYLIPDAWRARQLKSCVNTDGSLTIPVFIDFHVNLSAGMDVEDVWRGVSRKNVLGEFIKVQSPTSMLWFSAARVYNEAFQHGTPKLQMIGDIDALLRDTSVDVDWAEVLTLSNKYGTNAPLYHVLKQMKELFDAPVPQGVLQLLEPRSGDVPDANDWGDVIPKLLGRQNISALRLAG